MSCTLAKCRCVSEHKLCPMWTEKMSDPYNLRRGDPYDIRRAEMSPNTKESESSRGALEIEREIRQIRQDFLDEGLTDLTQLDKHIALIRDAACYRIAKRLANGGSRALNSDRGE